MGIEELHARGKKLEQDLCAANERLISEFEKDTGFYVSRVDVDIALIETAGEPDRYTITGVNIDTSI